MMGSSSASNLPGGDRRDVGSSENTPISAPNGAYRSRVLKGLVSRSGDPGQHTVASNDTRPRSCPGPSQALWLEGTGKTAAEPTAGFHSAEDSESTGSSSRLPEEWNPEMESSDSDSDAGSPAVLSDDPCASEARTVTRVSKRTRHPNDQGVRQLHGVAVTEKTKKRVWDRRNTCPFCEKQCLKLSRHMARRHRDEPKMQDVLKLKKGSKERRIQFQLLCNRGNYIHNMKVKSGVKKGALIPARRMRTVGRGSRRGMKDFVPCEYCKGFYPRSLLMRHIIAVHNTPGSGSGNQAETESMVPVTGQEPRTTESVFRDTIFGEDSCDVTSICKDDPLILRFGEWLQRTDAARPRQCIRSKMMVLGRLVRTFRVNNEGASLSDILTGGNFSEVVDCLRAMSPCSYKACTSCILPLAVEIGPCLARCATLLKVSLIEKGQDVSTIRRFLQWYHRDWIRQISRGAGVYEVEDDEEDVETGGPQLDEINRREEVLTTPKRPPRVVRKRVGRGGWSDEERAAVIRQLGWFFEAMRAPGKEACERAIAAEPVLQNRPWRDLKNFVHNAVQAAKRAVKRE